MSSYYECNQCGRHALKWENGSKCGRVYGGKGKGDTAWRCEGTSQPTKEGQDEAQG